jgi:hypothetical protein
MNVLKIINNHFDSLTRNEKLSLLIDVARATLAKKRKEEHSLIFSKVLEESMKNIFPSERLSKVLLSLLMYCQNTNDSFKLYLIDTLLKIKPNINFNYYSPKYNLILGLVLFETIRKTQLKEAKKLDYYKKLLKWISKKEKIENLFFIDNRDNTFKLEFIAFFVFSFDNHDYSSLIYHMAIHHQKYNINLINNHNCFFRILFWNYSNNKKVIALRKKIIKNLPDKLLKEQFIYSLKNKEPSTLLDCLILFSEPSNLNYLLENKKHLITEEESIFNLIVNFKLNFEEKKAFLLRYKNIIKMLPLTIIIEAIKRMSQQTEENCLDFFNFCQNNFTITYELKKNNTFHHLYCSTNYVSYHNLDFIEKMLSTLNLDLTHKPNQLGQYPLHNLINYDSIEKENIEISIQKVIKKLKQNHVDFNCQTTKGNTPLHIAIKAKRSSFIIKELILCGSSLLIKNKYDKTPYDYIKKYPYYSELENFVNATYEKEMFENLIVNDETMKNPKKGKL